MFTSIYVVAYSSKTAMICCIYLVCYYVDTKRPCG